MATPTPSGTVPKRPIPLNAAAFTFSLDSPATKSKRSRPLNTFLGDPSFPSTPQRSAQTPSRQDVKPTVSYETPKKAFTTLDALPSPFLFRAATPQAGPSRPTRPLNDLLDEVSPFRPGSKSRDRKEEEKPGIRLGDLPGQRMSEDVGRRVKEVVMEDEGVGVSPRKSKTGIRWVGKGYVRSKSSFAGSLR